MIKISGQITIQGIDPLLAQLPFGLTVELTATQGSASPGGWIGAGPVNPASCTFEIFTAYSITQQATVNYAIYRDTQLVQQGQATVNNYATSIQLTADAYNDLFLTGDEGCGVVVAGNISLGEKNIAAVPADPAQVKVFLYKGLFRGEELIGSSTINALGNYRIHVPRKKLYVNTGQPQMDNEDPSLAEVFVCIKNGQTVLVQSPYTNITQDKATADLHIDNAAQFSLFKYEFDNLRAAVMTASGLAEAQLYTITTGGDKPEINVIAANTGQSIALVRMLVDAYKINNSSGMTANDAYALSRMIGGGLLSWGNLAPADITAAINAAFNNRVVPSAGNISATIQVIQKENAETVSENKDDDEHSLRIILRSILDTDAQVDSFLKLNLEQNGSSVEQFWSTVQASFGAATTSKLQRGFQLLAITGVQPEMTKALLATIGTNPVEQQLSTMTEAQWLTYVTQVCTANQKLCIPKSIRGNVTDINNQQVKADYAAKLYELTTDIFATTVAKNRIQSDTQFAACFQEPQQVTGFLQANAGYDLRINNAWETDFGGNEVLKNDMLPLQNLARLAGGKPDAVVQMMKAGIRSSAHIAALPEEDFVAAYSGVLKGTAKALEVYNKAVHTDMVVKQSYLQLMPGGYLEKVTKNWNKAIWIAGGQQSPTTPDLESLFGSLDFCSCSDCTSMYSPAAYFTDILNFIKTRLGSGLAYTELTRRRPDLIHIDLSCKNSNTPLPYIDLVNEQLELIILKDIKANEPGESGLLIPDSFQTSATEKELAAYPEHTYKDTDGSYKAYKDYTKVYDLRLKKAVYPNSLPFDLALEESRVYLKHLGYKRYELMDLYKPKDYLTLTDASLISEYNMNAEWLGISKTEADIITKSSSPAIDVWKFYGFDLAGTWYNDLCSDIEGLLKKCNITYKELLRLLVTDFLNKEAGMPSQRPFAIVSKSGRPVDSCQIEDLMLQFRQPVPPVDEAAAKTAFFDKLHRFIRLYRATSWSIYQLDMVLSSLGAADINTGVFKNVCKASQWSARLVAPPEKIAILWSNISTAKYINFDSSTQDFFPSVYDSFFRNKAILNPSDPNFDNPASILGTTATNRGTILAAFNIADDDLLYFTGGTDVPVTLALLSNIYRYTLLVKAFSFASFRELGYALAVSGTAFPSGTMASLISGFDQLFAFIARLQDSPFSLYESLYLLTHQDPGNAFIPSSKAIQPFYETLRLELRNLVKEGGTAESEDLLKKVVTEKISAVFGIDNKTASFLITDVVKAGTVPAPLIDVLIEPLFIDSTSDIIPGNGITGLDFDDLYEAYYKLDKISRMIFRLKLSAEEVITYQQNYQKLSVIGFNQLPVIVTATTATLTGSFFNLGNWVALRDKLSLTKEEAIQLMLVSSGTKPGGGTAVKNDWLTLVQDLTQWDMADITTLAGNTSGTGLLNMTYNATVTASNDFRNASLLLTVNDILAASSRTGLRPVITFEALRPGLTVATSQTVRKAAKAKYTDDEWLKIAKPLQDQLRERQRKALVAFIIARPDIISGNNMKWKNENDLFAYLLIDVEMQPCMQTSRIRQAINSLQLYIDRIILNIERVNGSTTAITMNQSVTDQWQTWRKWYRVWEANRKVFLYPENWIEPELRDNKTPFFKELETQLLQDEVTAGRVEDAYRAYLERLDEVARLEPVSAYHELTADNDIVHVFARTDMHPNRYFYRRLEDNEWSAWERINLDINSDHVVPLMWNNRLYLFWLTFQNVPPVQAQLDQELAADASGAYSARSWIDNLTQPDGGSAPVISDSGNNRYNQWNITLNWSLYQDSQWKKFDIGKDIMNIDISKVLINNNAIASYGNTGYAQTVLQVLTKRGEVRIDELFKNRLYLFAPMEDPGNEEEGICFNLLFPAGLDENGIGLHTFLWKGDNNRDPYVLRDNDRGYQSIAPLGTRFNRMKFEEDPTQDGKLRKDSYIIEVDGYHSYSAGYYVDNFTRWVRSSSSQVILNNTPYNRFRITARSDKRGADGLNPLEDKYFFEDEKHTFYVQKIQGVKAIKVNLQAVLSPAKVSLSGVLSFAAGNYNISFPPFAVSNAAPSLYLSSVATVYTPQTYKFNTFYHAQVPRFMGALNRGGVPELLKLSNQAQTDTMNFASNYQPTLLVNTLYPKNNVQFDFSDAYSIYNWEIFFHAPMLIAQGLSNNQQFEDAQKWYHYIFNPTSNTNISGSLIGTNQRFWKFYPFYVESGLPAQTLSELIISINNNVETAVAQVRTWERNPFNPHIIARMRILAYMKNVLMKYLDNLIAWGDQLFRRDTIESVNEATQLYVLAANILGDRPTEIPPRVKKAVYTFDELLENGPLDALSNAMVAIESYYAPNAGPVSYIPPSQQQQQQTPAPPKEGLNLETLYFCLPKNDKLLAYWDTIADRLFKIRNCMNIDGTLRQLPLYEPPIDPALLVRATAMGVDINTVLDQISGINVPLYRFNYVVQKANELIGDVKALGGALLSALEKKDAEALALLRSGQEIQVLESARAIREMQIRDAETALEALQKTKENTQYRFTYYSTRPFKNANEEEHLNRLESAKDFQLAQGIVETVAGILSALPTFHLQLFASGVSYGGLQLANVMHAVSSGLGIKVAYDNMRATMAVTTGGYERRRDDWVFQANSAQKELEQVDRQILGAEIRIDMAKKELDNHDLQIANAKEVDAYMRSKYTNVELYNWMIAQVSATYFQSYQLAYDMAKRAEWCYTHELPVANLPSTGFVKFGYWDSLRKGLMSGERLQFDLRKMEATYMEENKRELELTKSFSLAMINPAGLIDLRTGGQCTFDLNQLWFDLDFPGHYLRRIKSVSLSIPCVAGPYTTVAAQLTLTGHSMYDADDDPIAVPGFPNTEMIATSGGQNDAGVFELSFRDERYVPFEHKGAISSWSLDMMKEKNFRQFDYTTINDVIVHLKYTARNDEDKAVRVMGTLNAALNASGNLYPCYISTRHQCSNDWINGFNQLVNVGGQPVGRPLNLSLLREFFPEYAQKKALDIQSVTFYLSAKNTIPASPLTEYKVIYNSTTNVIASSSVNSKVITTGTALDFTVNDVSRPFNFILYKEVAGVAMAVTDAELNDLFLTFAYTMS